jgi:hypothetical protein
MTEERSFSVVAVTLFGKKEVACCATQVVLVFANLRGSW